VLLVPIRWAGLDLNTGDRPDGLFTCVEDVEGWLDSPGLDGHDVSRELSDGSAWGPKTLQARIITMTGVVAGPRPLIGRFRDLLAGRAASRTPADLTIVDGGMGRELTASVRADTELYRQTWLNSTTWRWQVTLTAADPVLYDGWQDARLTVSEGGHGRTYNRTYDWRYATPYLPNSALLVNQGNWPAQVIAVYRGDLSASTLTDDQGGVLRMAPVAFGVEIMVNTATLEAEAAGGMSRASYVLPGSRPLSVPAATDAAPGSSRWHLYGTGHGEVLLAWRSSWV
jgi:hypothetical protein